MWRASWNWVTLVGLVDFKPVVLALDLFCPVCLPLSGHGYVGEVLENRKSDWNSEREKLI